MKNAVLHRSSVSFFALLAVAMAGSVMPRPALALPMVSYALEISENALSGGGPLMASGQLVALRDVPLFKLTNMSTETTATITNFSITIGDLSYNFDRVIFLQPTSSVPQVTSFTPDQAEGKARSDVLSLAFTNFAPSISYSFRADIDRDSDGGLALTNFRTVLQGASPAVVTVRFSEGSVLTQSLSELFSVYRCSALASTNQVTSISQIVTAVPEPNGLTLACLGAGGVLALVGWRRYRPARAAGAA